MKLFTKEEPLVFVVSQFLYVKWITPLQKYKEIKQKVAYCLTFYAYCYANPIVFKQGQRLGEEYNTASNELRQVAAELRGFAEIPARIHFGIPKKEDLIDASFDLIGLSNGLRTSSEDTMDLEVKNNYKLVGHIAELLKLKGYNKTVGKE